MRTQYGENLFYFRDLPEIARELKECGVDALLIFGWHSGGHDNDYPNYTVSGSPGGFEAFKKAISEVKLTSAGTVTLKKRSVALFHLTKK